MNLKILVCCYKDDMKLENKYYMPIQVGKKTSNKDLQMTGDDTGDNISSKNSSYCELTGLYWAWKNLTNIDYIGLCHYRRYFNFSKVSKLNIRNKELHTSKFSNLSTDIPDRIANDLENGYVIVPKKERLKLSLYIEYSLFHVSEDLRHLEKIIENRGDQKYIDAFNQIMYNNNELYACNMFVMNWSEFDKYCSWLFSVLGEAEESIDISNYNSYQKRIFGFMSERLFNVYLLANNIKVRSYPMILFTDKPNSESLFKYLVRIVFNKISSKYTAPNKKYFER